jgi:hypothetical protein
MFGFGGCCFKVQTQAAVQKPGSKDYSATPARATAVRTSEPKLAAITIAPKKNASAPIISGVPVDSVVMPRN